MTTSSSPLGVVFDLDGVLIDSHDQHESSWFTLAKEIGKPMTKELFKESFGMRNEMCIPNVFEWSHNEAEIKELGERKEELYRELLISRNLDPLPGVLDLVENLKRSGIPISLGSSTSRKNIEVCFQSTGLDSYFGSHYTGAEDVARGKPNPDVFLRAAEKIEREPANCLVIEDAHVGVEAGLAAGMKVIAVTTTHPSESFANSGAHLIVGSLTVVNAEVISGIIGC
ncbi:MAG: glycoprotease [Verrucomicrobiales bacterium]|jgi:HAD superfamily hydrolase (TIGR01509 family)|nr:glycoprotease [Verrucomicrobiales bacterium]|tara:strand:+ start:7836 stop:8516 length:681 start_codon:yes stop_codon:yes gene_type:complete